MKNDSAVSEPPSATTSRASVGPPSRTGHTPADKRAECDEAEFLQHQARCARAAIDATLEDLKGSLKHAADIRLWTRQHPWAATGAAAAAGFAAAAAVRGAFHAHDEEKPTSNHDKHAPSAQAASPPSGGRPTVLASLLSAIFNLAALAARHWVTAAVQGKTAAQAEPDAPSQRSPASQFRASSQHGASPTDACCAEQP